MILNIFTHRITNITIDKALLSFIDTFGSAPDVRIWKDGENTKGLADGYIKAVESCTEDYIFMLEHDWEFIRTPKHSLKEIVEMMRKEGIVHLRFNKRVNAPAVLDRTLEDKGWYCETPFVSNNPHIIDRKAYLTYIDNGWIQRHGGSKGVEEVISKHINGAVYGGLGYPQVIHHLRGR